MCCRIVNCCSLFIDIQLFVSIINIISVIFLFAIECFTPSDQSGICINLRSCPRLRFLLENERKNATVVSLLRNSFCGYEGKEIKVCCPLDDEVFTTTEYSSTTKKRTEPTTAGGQQIVLSSKLPSQNTCGKTNTSQNRIVGGHPADLGEYSKIVTS